MGNPRPFGQLGGMSQSPPVWDANVTPVEGRWSGGRMSRGLVDLLQEADQMAAGDPQLEGGPAAVSAVPGERGQHLFALQHVDLALEPPGGLRLRGRAVPRIEDLDEGGPVQQLLLAGAEEDGLDLVLQLAHVA